MMGEGSWLQNRAVTEGILLWQIPLSTLRLSLMGAHQEPLQQKKSFWATAFQTLRCCHAASRSSLYRIKNPRSFRSLRIQDLALILSLTLKQTKIGRGYDECRTSFHSSLSFLQKYIQRGKYSAVYLTHIGHLIT